ncbi:sugar transferase [Microscilla marina]|uniref:Sugar transferases involved in lipopolysaccharide synthesis n=1 Tax=Microscilla marina ATCC 23134 TaxID=313606 RepID=A1ZKF0_MICM2|nr:sugar transferase [Microscilla marina]EAY29176.1 sugar transferases involved in lipopolysaccharide synthesis [Microscilla marina ATCC 23134]
MLSRIIFLQERIGYQNQPFYIIKLKTMRDLRDEQGNLLPDKQRVTTIGKFLRKTSLDELPQLINILKGDMRLVGPRPLLPEYLPLYTPQQLKRHSVKPGITGWAQVNGRNSLTWQQKFELDLWYVENRSFRLDLKILWLTFLNIFRKRDGDELAEKFNGKN